MSKINFFKELIKKHDYQNAIINLESFIGKNKKNYDAIYLLGLAYEKNFEYRKAIDKYKIVLKFSKKTHAYDRIGEVCIKMNDFKSAKKYFLMSLKINENNSITQNNLGLVLAYLEKEKKSIKHFKRAMTLNPNYKGPVYNLLEIYEKSNDNKNLNKIIKTSINRFKDDQIIQYYYALILEKENELDKALLVLKRINFENYDNAWDIKKYYQLGIVNDKLKNYSESFKFFEKANKKTLNLIGKNYLKNNLYIKKIDRQLKDSYKDYKINKRIKNHKYKHFFLVGFPRSGTTLLDTIMRSHKKIIVIEEKPVISKISQEINTLKGINVEKLNQLSKMYFNDLLENINKVSTNNKVIIDKLPLNIVEGRLINHIFPNAKFIVAIRHPLDCVLSAFMQQFKLNDAMVNFLDLKSSAIMYDKVMQIWTNYSEIPRKNVCNIKYEKLTHNFKKTILNLMSFLDLEWDEKLLDFNQTANKREMIRTPSYKQVTQPIYKSSTYKWINYNNELKSIKPILNKWIKYYGY